MLIDLTISFVKQDRFQSFRLCTWRGLMRHGIFPLRHMTTPHLAVRRAKQPRASSNVHFLDSTVGKQSLARSPLLGKMASPCFHTA